MMMVFEVINRFVTETSSNVRLKINVKLMKGATIQSSQNQMKSYELS